MIWPIDMVARFVLCCGTGAGLEDEHGVAGHCQRFLAGGVCRGPSALLRWRARFVVCATMAFPIFMRLVSRCRALTATGFHSKFCAFIEPAIPSRNGEGGLGRSGRGGRGGGRSGAHDVGRDLEVRCRGVGALVRRRVSPRVRGYGR